LNSRMKIVTASLWLFLPLVAFRNWQVWDRLPARVAVHFDIAGRPNGWMSREGSLQFILLFMVAVLAVASLVMWRVRMPSSAAWAVLGVFYVVLGVLYCGEESILAYNLDQAPSRVLTIVITSLVAVFGLTTLYLVSGRGPQLPTTGHVFADEVHASPVLAFAMFAPALAELILAAKVPAGVRIVLVLSALVLAAVATMAWGGFHYLFKASGVEIRTLGFRLRSIPAEQIREYAITRWNPLGGYGIRGIGNRRAYVWGNQGVRITTTDGQIFLGHRDPARIIHDLDAIKQFAH
jgi:hypothetical protein